MTGGILASHNSVALLMTSKKRSIIAGLACSDRYKFDYSRLLRVASPDGILARHNVSDGI